MFFIHSSVDGHLGGFSFLAVRNYPAMKGGVLVFVSSCVFISLGYTPGSGIMKSFNFLKNHQTVFTVSQFHSGYTILHSHQQCVGVPVALHSHQNLLLSNFLLS